MKVLWLFLSVVASVHSCGFPPRLWCSSEAIASKCNVYHQCKEWGLQAGTEAAPVSLELYYESLCPDCQNFWNQQLYSTYNKVGHIMNLTLVPYGNAEEKRVGDKWKFDCQHGEMECVGNILETCAIHILKDMKTIVPFLHCMEQSEKPMESVKRCATQHSVPLTPILSCYNGSLGNELEHQMALQTDALKPEHQYVPWLVLNGVHTEKINDEATNNLLKLICDTYKGPKPEACSDVGVQKLPGCPRYTMTKS